MGHRILAHTNAILTSSMLPVCQNLLFCGQVPPPLTLLCGVHPSPLQQAKRVPWTLYLSLQAKQRAHVQWHFQNTIVLLANIKYKVKKIMFLKINQWGCWWKIPWQKEFP